MKRFIFTLLIIGSMRTYADLALSAGEIYTLEVSSISNWVVWASPDYPAYDDYSFTVGFADDLYSSPSDEMRIRLYGEVSDLIPYATIFEPGTLVPNLTTSPNMIRQTQVLGTLWHDGHGKLEIEVITGSVQLDYISIQKGPGNIAWTGSIDVIPEPSSMPLLLLGAGILYKSRKLRTRACTSTRKPRRNL